MSQINLHINANPGTLIRLRRQANLPLQDTLSVTAHKMYTDVPENTLAEVIASENSLISVWWPTLKKYSTKLWDASIYWKLANEEK